MLLYFTFHKCLERKFVGKKGELLCNLMKKLLLKRRLVLIRNLSVLFLLISYPLSRLQLQYEVSGDSSPPDICNGHSPAITITFTCPSSRHLVHFII